jgi:hypothetical protein
MNYQRGRTQQQSTTSLTPAQVLGAAKEFFGPKSSVYAAFVEREGPNHLVLRGQGGEEIVIGAWADEKSTGVTGSSYMFDQQVARFLSSLPVVSDASAA